MDTRIGYPNEHLAHDSNDELSSPIYATSVGLLMSGIEVLEKQNKYNDIVESTKKPKQAEFVAKEASEEAKEIKQEEKSKIEALKQEQENKRKGILDRWTERLKDFLENAE